MKVGIIGCGVIGDAFRRACIAKGIEVVAYDPNKEGMKDRSVIQPTDLVFLCLPTPTMSGVQNISALEATLEWLYSIAYKGPVVIRSTVLPGTVNTLQEHFSKLNLAHCPEFLTAATPLEDLIKQTAILVGSSSAETLATVVDFWTLFDKKTPIFVFHDPLETEMAKYMHNCFLATKVSFFNDMFELCEHIGGTETYRMAVAGANAIGQVGKGHTAVPGPDGERGYGGMCFPKDMNALYALCSTLGLPAETLRGARTGNERRRLKPEDR